MGGMMRERKKTRRYHIADQQNEYFYVNVLMDGHACVDRDLLATAETALKTPFLYHIV